MHTEFAQVREEQQGTIRSMRVGRDWRRPSAPGDWAIYWRKSDGFGQILPRPTPEEVSAFYDIEDYYTHDVSPTDNKPTPGYWRALQHLSWCFDHSVNTDRSWWAQTLGSDSLSCIDIGGGDGYTLTILRELGHRVIGVEPDPLARKVANEKGLTVHPGTAEALPEAILAERFDVVMLFHVLEHCIDPSLALTNASNLLKPNGRLIVEVPNNACLGATMFGASWFWLDVPRHLNFFTPQSLEGDLSSSGFVVQSVSFAGYYRQFTAGWAALQKRISAVTGDRRGRQSWRYPVLLALTALAPPKWKYDSVRVVAGLKR